MIRNLLAAVAVLCLAAPVVAQSSDPFGTYADNVSGPCRSWAIVTPSDTVDLPTTPKAIYNGGAGDITMVGVGALPGATGVKWSGVPASSLLPVRPRRIYATGTTATLIVACY